MAYLSDLCRKNGSVVTSPNLFKPAWRVSFAALPMLALLTLLLNGCSASRSSNVIPLPLEKHATFEAIAANRDSQSIIELKPLSAGPDTLRGFATALYSCGYPRQSSLKGTSRQMFVGLEKLKILSQEAIEISTQRLWRVDAEAVSDGSPLWLTTFSMKRDRCFFDYALWVPKPLERPIDLVVEQQLNDLQSNFLTIVEQALPKE